MKQTHYQQLFFLSIINLLLISPLLAIMDAKNIKLSRDEEHIIENYDNTYVYLGSDVSNIGAILSSIDSLNDDKRSILHALQNHIENGFLIGLYDEVLEALHYAETVLCNKSGMLEVNQREELLSQFNDIAQQTIKGELNINRSSCANLSITNEIVDNLTITNCMANLCVNDLSVVNTIVSDIVFASSGDIGTLNVDCNLTVGCNISMNDSVSPAVGNVIKNGAPFIHNFGTKNTFVGDNAGNFIMTGAGNTGFGFSALESNTIGSGNAAFGKQALMNNTTGVQNTAIGNGTLEANTIGLANTAVGNVALFSNTTGNLNTALGQNALNLNVTGSNNTAVGHNALANHLVDDTVALGLNALVSNTTGAGNTALGYWALAFNTIGSDNIAVGNLPLPTNVTGNDNIAIGNGAGAGLTTGSGNIYIDSNAGAMAESTTTRIGTSQTAAFIAGIYGATTGMTNAIAVLVDSNGQLGTVSSSIQVKDRIAGMDDDSSKILELNPVTFVYKNDATATKQYGLIAEEVNEIFPAIVVKDENGNPLTIQYHVLPVLLLNEIKKQHMRFARVEERLAALEARA